MLATRAALVRVELFGADHGVADGLFGELGEHGEGAPFTGGAGMAHPEASGISFTDAGDLRADLGVAGMGGEAKDVEVGIDAKHLRPEAGVGDVPEVAQDVEADQNPVVLRAELRKFFSNLVHQFRAMLEPVDLFHAVAIATAPEWAGHGTGGALLQRQGEHLGALEPADKHLPADLAVVVSGLEDCGPAVGLAYRLGVLRSLETTGGEAGDFSSGDTTDLCASAVLQVLDLPPGALAKPGVVLVENLLVNGSGLATQDLEEVFPTKA